MVAGASQATAGVFAERVVEALDPVQLVGDGPHNITHAAHSNRDVFSSNTGYTEAAFAVTATSAAEEGDLVTIDYTGNGMLTGSGVLKPTPGFKVWAARGETLIASYDAGEDLYYSKTLDIRKAGREPTFQVLPALNSATLSTIGANAPALLGGSALAGVTSSASSVYTHAQLVAINQATTTANGFTGINLPASDGAIRVPTPAIPYTIKVGVIGAINDALTHGSFAMGLLGGTVNGAQPSTFINVIQMCADTDDTNMSIRHCANGGSSTQVALGSSFPNASGNLYWLIVDTRSDDTYRHCIWNVVNLTTGAVAYGRITTNLPAVGSALATFLVRGNQAQSGTAFSVHFGGFFAGAYS